MTDKLKDLLHDRAEAVDFDTPDVDSVTRAGDRRRRTRAAVVGGAAAVVLAAGAAVGVPLLLDGSGGSDDGVRVADGADGSATAGQVTWVTGQTLHTTDGDTDLGHEVKAYVATADGYVLADPEGTVWSVVDGQANEVGSVDAKAPHLVSDTESGLAGWLDTSEGSPAYVVLDQDTGETTRYDGNPAGTGDAAGPGSTAYFYALDGHTAYWRDARGAVAVDVTTGDAHVVDGVGNDDITAVEDGRIALNDRNGNRIGISADPLKGSYGGPGSFSPDGAWFTEDADEPKVWDAGTGRQVDLDLQYNFAAGYGWLDDQTVLLIGQDGWQDPVELVACTVPDGACHTVVPDLGSFDDLDKDGFSLPVGSPVGE